MHLDTKVTTTRQRLIEVDRDHAPACLASSFGAEDMVLTDLIADSGLNIIVITLDTGRLPQETYDLIERTRRRYGIDVEIVFPDRDAIEAFVRDNGPNAFYTSVELRKECCGIRKVEPLKRALAGRRAWITGMRRAQSPTRAGIGFCEWDDDHGIYKYNPLADWRERDVWDYIRDRDVPYNTLHDQGYASIGCAPCTRPITAGEDIRAGRWWWEEPEQKECGLHVHEESANHR